MKTIQPIGGTRYGPLVDVDLVQALDGLSGTYRSADIYERYRQAVAAQPEHRHPASKAAVGRRLRELGFTNHYVSYEGRAWTISAARVAQILTDLVTSPPTQKERHA